MNRRWQRFRVLFPAALLVVTQLQPAFAGFGSGRFQTASRPRDVTNTGKADATGNQPSPIVPLQQPATREQEKLLASSNEKSATDLTGTWAYERIGSQCTVNKCALATFSLPSLTVNDKKGKVTGEINITQRGNQISIPDRKYVWKGGKYTLRYSGGKISGNTVTLTETAVDTSMGWGYTNSYTGTLSADGNTVEGEVVYTPSTGNNTTKTSFIWRRKVSQFALTRATTTDAKSVTVDYTVEATNSGESSEPIHFEIYRSSTKDADHAKEKIGQQDIKIGENDIPNSTNSSPDKHKVQLNLPVDSLKPNTAAPYVVVVATYNGKKSTTYFQKWMLGVISHGFDRLNAKMFFGYISLGSGYYGIPNWESNMANNLKKKYDDVISFDWSKTCALAEPDMAIQAGANLSKKITQWVLTHRQHDGDVVDIHLIGHSRGTVVVTQALQHLSTASPSFEGGYIELTLLDPHPASNKFGQWADFERDKDGKLTSLAAIGANITAGFQSKADDPAVKIPLNVKKIEVWYQHTLTKYLIKAPDQEDTMNLWGIIDAITNESGLPIQWHELTAPGIGHNQIPDVYEEQVVETGTLNRSN